MTDISNNSSNENSPDDLEWIAFQYLSNELSEQETDAFETRLAETQDAREALTRATQLVAGLKSMELTPTTKTFTAPAQPAPLETNTASSFLFQQWALTSCAALVLVVTTFLLTKPVSEEMTSSQTAQTELSEEDLEHVLELWAEPSEEISGLIVSLNSGTDSADLIDQQSVLAENQTLDIPDWLYTAVALPEESVN